MSGRTGARRPAAVTPPAAQGVREVATYRGVRWRKDPDGAIGWFNEDAGGWIRWRPGADAPPLPPRWEADAARIPAPPRVRRAPWTSPYRLAPVALILGAIAIGAWQATRDSGAAAARIASREAHALVGKCLARTSAPGVPVEYGTTPVGCSSHRAVLRVVAVHTARTTGPQCPAGDRVLELAYAGARTADIECAVPVVRR
ncbi:MAG: hypothetical protein ACYDEN_09910 [Acidimicrobiales bacterium]